MLGLDSAGKTTVLYRLKFDQYLNTVPTIGFNCEKVRGVGKAKGVSFLVWDVGGQEKLRPLWRSYTRCTDGIVFVVDSVDTERIEEAKMELMRTAKCPENIGVPVLVLANKQDLPGALDPKEIEKLLGLHELTFAAPVVSSSNCTGASSSTSSTQLSQAAAAAAAAQQQQQSSPSGMPLKMYHVQSSCAVTGEGLNEGLEVLYEMITKKRKLSKNSKKKR
ncbi:ADP-ribosylation factor-like protein 4C isoform X2 [Culicoides brevitarsis]